MTQRQRRYAELYAITGNGLQSAIAAGYSPRSARHAVTRNRQNADVIGAIRIANQRNLQVTRAKVEQVLLSAINKALTGNRNTAQLAANRAVRLANRIGLFSQQCPDCGHKTNQVQRNNSPAKS